MNTTFICEQEAGRAQGKKLLFSGRTTGKYPAVTGGKQPAGEECFRLWRLPAPEAERPVKKACTVCKSNKDTQALRPKNLVKKALTACKGRGQTGARYPAGGKPP